MNRKGNLPKSHKNKKYENVFIFYIFILGMERYIFKIFIHDRTRFTDTLAENAQMFNTFLFGIRFIIKTISINDTEIVNQIWVNNYSARIDFILPVLMRGSRGIIFIFDCKNPMHLVDDLTQLPNLLTESNMESIPVFLLGINSLQLNELEYMHLERTIQNLIIPIPNAHYVSERNINFSPPFFDYVLKIINKSFIYQEDIHSLINQGVETSKLFEIHRKNITTCIKIFEQQMKMVEGSKDQFQNLNLEHPKPEQINHNLSDKEIEKIKESLIEFEKQKLEEMRKKASSIIQKIKGGK